MKEKLISIYGWYGTIAIILAYTLISFSVIKSQDITYQLLNGTGALGIVLEAYTKKDYQATVLNILWTIVALLSIIKILAL